jgi:hypothetical protein
MVTKTKRLLAFLVLGLLLITAGSASAQSYNYTLPNYEVHAYWNEDGSLGIFYAFDFANNPSGHPIEYVDVGLPNANFNVNNIFADINGQRLNISRSDFEGSGVGVAVVMGQHAIPPGGRGVVNFHATRIEKVLFPDTEDPDYASAVFSPAWFNPQGISGSTNMSVTFHLPPGVQPDEPRWHSAPSGFPDEPETGFDEDGRVLYTWRNENARPDRQYLFGASFPRSYVPEDSIGRAGLSSGPGAVVGPETGGFGWALPDLSCLFPLCFFGFFIGIIVLGIYGERHRKLKYLPPKVSIEGHGIKRGLSAVEAGILMEQPVDKVLTMILFGLIKKNAVQVASRDPLRLEAADPLPEGLREYELRFIEAFKAPSEKARQRALQDVIINLIKSVSNKMKGFSLRETVAYYKDIMERAWKQVEAADTPDVKSQKFDENMEWTMLDREFDKRTRDVFRTGPVFVPVWWGRYDPSYGRPTATQPTTTTSGPIPTSMPTSGAPVGGGKAMPTLPGGEFAASMVTGMQSFSSRVVGNLTDFTGRITQTTNPPPPPSRSTGSGRSGGGGGGGCACACACAGCACACAGGGR